VRIPALGKAIPIDTVDEAPASASAESSASDELDPAARRFGRLDALFIVSLLALIAFVSWVRFWHRPGLGDWDIMSFYLPWYGFLGDQVRHLDVPGWNPYLFSGSPFAGNPQSGWMYFPAMILFALFNAALAFKLFFAFHFALGAISSYLLVRVLGIGPFGAFAAGLVFAFSQNVGAAGCCTNHVQLTNWLPLALLGVELARRTQRLESRLLALSLSGFAFSQVIAGWLGQGTYYAGLTIGSYIVFRELFGSSPERRAWRQRLVACVIDGGTVCALGVGIAAAGILPRFDVVRRTYVGTAEYRGIDFDPNRGWDWWTVLGVTIGYRPEWHPFYIGGAVLVCAVIALWSSRRYRFAPYFLVFFAVVWVLPLRPTPFHRLVYLLPGFKGLHLHDPGRILALLPVATAILAAVAIDSLPALLRSRRGLMVPALGLIVWLAVVAFADNKDVPISWLTWVAVLAALGTVAAAMLLVRYIRRGWLPRAALVAQICLAVALFGDPEGYAAVRSLAGTPDHSTMRTPANALDFALGTVPPSPYDDRTIRDAIAVSVSRDDPGGAGEFLQEQQAASDQPFRFFGFANPPDPNWQAHEHYLLPEILPLLMNGRSIRLGLEDIQGYDPAHLNRYREFMQALNGMEREYHEENVYASGLSSPLLDLLNVEYVIVPNGVELGQTEPSDRYREVFRNESVRVLQNTRALPRTWIVHEAQQVGSSEALGLLAGGQIDPAQTALLEKTPPALDPAGGAESVSVTRYENDRVVLDTEMSSNGLVMLGDVYDPGWRVYVDGKQSELYAADYLLRAVAVPAGRHSIEFRYEPTSLKAGLWISFFSILAAAGLALWVLCRSLVRTRRRST
jgi:hypothetical protein